MAPAYAIELLFDADADAAVRKVWERVRDASGSSLLFDLEARPHVSLAVYDDADAAVLEEAVFGFDTAPLDFALASAGSFPGEEGVIFIAPVADEALLALHRRWHHGCPGSLPHYRPGSWVPHCTVGIRLAEPALGSALAVARRALPLRGRFEAITLIRFERYAKPIEYLTTRGLDR
ncbi:MAG: 2'-5' RNA ligase family protein [Planctomycetota bacterium]|jgi:2'-5' RNA ligase